MILLSPFSTRKLSPKAINAQLTQVYVVTKGHGWTSDLLSINPEPMFSYNCVLLPFPLPHTERFSCARQEKLISFNSDNIPLGEFLLQPPPPPTISVEVPEAQSSRVTLFEVTHLVNKRPRKA